MSMAKRNVPPRGKKQKVGQGQNKRCNYCHGTGRCTGHQLFNKAFGKCPKCNGTGQR